MKNKIYSLLFSIIIILTMGIPVFAAETQVPTVSASITKEFEMAEGITIPTVTFNFTATPITKDAPTAIIKDISFSNADNKVVEKDGKCILSKNSEIEFKAFPHAGVFEYNVSETKGNVEGVIYSTVQYILRVYVENNNDGSLSIRSITATDSNEKKGQVLFTNTYVKNNASLVIKKITKGDFADKTKNFKFQIVFTPSATSKDTTFKGMIGNEPVICNAGVPKSFELHDNQQLEFNNLPVGTRYVVTENAAQDDYSPRVTVIENGTQLPDKVAKDEEELSSADPGKTNLIGENTNMILFTNTYKLVPITGLITNNLPFILLMVVCILGLSALVFIKIKRTSKR